MNAFDDFMERLEAALGDPEAREAFIEYVHRLTPEQQRELLAEAERRDPESTLEWNLVFDAAEQEESAPDMESDQVN